MAKQATIDTQAAATVVDEQSSLDSLLAEGFGQARLDRSPEIKSGVMALGNVLSEVFTEDDVLVSDDVIRTLQDMKAALDEKLSKQLNAVMHTPEFQKLEGTWRGLHTLVMKSELDDQLRLRVLNVTKEELAKTFDRFSGARWDKSPLYQKIYQHEFGMPGGQPYGAIIGDFEFSHNAQDIKVLSGVARVAAAAHCPFIAAADPMLMNMDDWTSLPDKQDITKLFSLPEYAAWRSLRESDDSRYVGLAFPRFMARLPYGEQNPSEGFNFTEEHEQHNQHVWSNAAYAMGLNITNAFTQHGWCCAIRGVDSGGRVEGLPVSVFETDDGGQDLKCPTEVAITMSQEQELANNGFMPLSHFKNTDYAAFIGAQSLHKPKVYNKAEANENAQLAARLPHMFATTRFAHYLKKMVYRKVGESMTREQVQKWLNNWIIDYVHPDPENATPAQKAEKPLSAAKVEVKEVEGDRGVYDATFQLVPHFQLERINVSLSLVGRLPRSQ